MAATKRKFRFHEKEKPQRRTRGSSGPRSRPSVVVIGGGIAGLAAALELSRCECSVVLLEAAARLGGRIHNLEHRAVPIELGAEFVHGRNPALFAAIKEAGLATRKMPETFRFWQRGKFQCLDFWTQMGHLVDSIPPTGPDFSFEDFLRRSSLPGQLFQLALGFAEGFDAARPCQLSAHAVLKAQHAADQMEGQWQGRLIKGYGALVRYFLQELKRTHCRVLKQAHVQNILWKPGHVRVSGQCRGHPFSMQARAAILTYSLGVWQSGSVSLSPQLPEKEQAAHALRFGHVLKPVLAFRRRWWPKSYQGIMQSLQEPLPTWWADPRGPLLTGWAGGPRAEALYRLSRQQLETLCLEILARLFSERVSTLRRQLVRLHFHRWENDPHIRGAYSYIPVGGLNLPKTLAAPVAKTLFFAGEATALDAQMGTVFGALESGRRAASEMREVLM